MKKIISGCLFLILISIPVWGRGERGGSGGINGAWLKDHNIIRVAGPKAFPPFHYIDENGNIAGMSADYLNIISNKLNIKMDMQIGLEWSEVLKKAQNKEIDLISCIGKTEDREAYLTFTDPYLSFPMVIVTRKEFHFIGGLQDLNNVKVAIMKNSLPYPWLVRDRINIIPYEVKSPLETLEAVSLGHADACIGNLAMATYYIEKKGLANLKIAAPTSYSNYDLFFAVRKDLHELAGIINKVLSNITREEHSSIRQKWIAVRYDFKPNILYILKWIIPAVSISIVIIIIILVWNRRMSKQITNRIKAEESLRQSEERYRMIFENSPLGIMQFDENGVINNCNEIFADIIGAPRERLIGFNMLKTMKDSPARSAVENAIKTGNGYFEGGYTTITGNKEIIIKAKHKGITRKDGKIIGVVSIFENITDRKHAEEELKKTRDYLTIILDSSPSAFICVNSEGIITIFNAAAQRLTGIDINHACGKKLETAIPDYAEYIEPITQVIKNSEPLIMEKVKKLCNATIRFYTIAIYPLAPPLRGWGDDISGAVLRIDDITEKARLEEMAIQNEKMLSIGSLAAGIAHEINNPLSGILQSAQNILRRLSPDLPLNSDIANECGTNLSQIRQYMEKREIIKFLQGIQISGNKASDIVLHMLSFTKCGNYNMIPSKLPEILDKAIALVANHYDPKKKYDFRQIKINKDYEPNIPDVPCSPIEIEQVILNLLVNSAQAMEKQNDKTPSITLRIKSEDKNTVRIDVIDNGPGMNEEIQKRMFEPFFTTKDVGIGTGLGLSVSYFIITNNHKGSMSVESSPGTGSTFIIRLPLHKK